MEVVTMLSRANDTDYPFFHGIAGIISSVYNIFAWEYHLEKVLCTQKREYFQNSEWVAEFIRVYIYTVNEVDDKLFKETGARIGE